VKLADIEKLKFVGPSWDPKAEGPIADSRSKIWEAEDGTRYEVLDRAPKYRTLITEEWKDLEP